MRVIGLAGWSGAGKTTLLERLIPALIARGVRVSTLKHAHHSFDVFPETSAAAEYRRAGAGQIMMVSPAGWALSRELLGGPEPGLPDLLARMARVDMVLIEGFKRWNHPKIEIHRAANGKPLLCHDDPAIAAIATDASIPGLAIPACHLDDIPAVADFAQYFAVSADDVEWRESPNLQGT